MSSCFARPRNDANASPRRLERVGAGHGPGVAEARIVGAVEQFARAQCRIKPGKGRDVRGRGALREVDRPQILRVFAVSDGAQGWRVLPGGLTRIATTNTEIASMQRGRGHSAIPRPQRRTQAISRLNSTR